MASDIDLRIRKIGAREILDSRGNPTVEAEVFTNASVGRAAIPSGASTGSYEAVELRDNDKSRYGGKGVLKAVRNIIEIIAPSIIGIDAREQEIIDNKMIDLDGTENKSNLGANAILGVSIASAKAAAYGLDKPLFRYLGNKESMVMPVPMMNVINGGKHAGNDLEIQEFMIIPVGADSFREALRIGAEIYQILKNVLVDIYGKQSVNVGDEGGFAPPCKTVDEAFESLSKAVKKTGYSLERDVLFAIDSAATEFYNKNNLNYQIDGKSLNNGELIDYYSSLVDNYPIVSIEDGLQEDDFIGFAEMTKNLGNKIQIVGDDLFVTNLKRLEKGIHLKAANCLLLKLNQIGTLTESRRVLNHCFRNDYNVIVSHRSGETEDSTISDLTVAFENGQIKTGAPARSERTAKYNRLIRIEESLGGQSKYYGIKSILK